MDIANNSSTVIKRDGESWSPWRTPCLRLTKGVRKTIINKTTRYIFIKRLDPRTEGFTEATGFQRSV